MKIKYFLLQVFSFVIVSVSFGQFIHDDVEKVWETTEDLKVPESVLYDTGEQRLYVANINGKPTDKDGNGFISTIDTKGNIQQLKWVTGLHAPKGMGIFAGKLYVSDIDQLVEINISDGDIVNKYDVPQAKFLNDIGIDKNGVVYVSDMLDNKIYILKDGEFRVWKTLTGEFDRPNGLYAEKNHLLVGLKDRVIKIDYSSKNAENYILNTGSIDGIVPYGNGQYLISDWQGSTHLIARGKEKVKLTDTTSDEVNAADIDFMAEEHLLLIPTFFANTVAAYKVKIK